MDWLLPMFVMATTPKPRRAALAEQMLFAAMPGSASQRLAIAAIGADLQMKRQARAEEQMIEEAVKAAKFKKLDELTPEAYPTLWAAFKRLPDSRQRALFPDDYPLKRLPGG